MAKNRLKNIKIKPKFIALLLIVGVIPMGLASWMAYRSALTALDSDLEMAVEAVDTEVAAQLSTTLQLRKDAIETYFNGIGDQLITLAMDPAIVDASREFASEMASIAEGAEPEVLASAKDAVGVYYRQQFAREYQSQNDKMPAIDSWLSNLSPAGLLLQRDYIAKNSHPLGSKHLLDAGAASNSYDRVHKKVHPFVREFLDKFGYYDIFIVDPKTGYVVYSVFKELDYATNLRTGAFTNSGLARAFQQATGGDAQGKVAFDDFACYGPSYEAPASFVATPIISEGETSGILVFQMPLDRITAVMSKELELSETFESYLVGQDLLPRSDTKFDKENRTVMASFRNPDAGRVQTDSAKSALAGKSDVGKTTNYLGAAVVSSYAPAKIFDQTWAVVADLDSSYAAGRVAGMQTHAADSQKALLSSLVLVAIIAASIIATLAWFLASKVVKPINSSLFAINELADGRLDTQVESSSNDEIGMMATGLASALAGIREAVGLDEVDWQDLARQNREVGRLQSSIEGLASGLMLTDSTGQVIFANPSLRAALKNQESTVREVVPGFSVLNLEGIEVTQLLCAEESSNIELLNPALLPLTREVHLGASVFEVGSSAIQQEGGEVTGFSIEWRDVSGQINARKELATVLNDAAKGSLDSRLQKENFSGFLKELSGQVNALLDSVVSPLREVLRVTASLEKGDLTQRMEGAYEGEFGLLKDALNGSLSHMEHVLTEMQDISGSISSSASEISANSKMLSQRTEDQASSLEETAASMEQQTGSVQQNAENARQAKTLAMEAREQAEQGGNVVQQAVSAMADINESSTKISDIIRVIDDIAFQTNLLALNAAVEAARAGEQGRGFAVVAGEVRNLAQRSAGAAQEVKTLIQDSIKKVEGGTQLVDDSGKTLDTIVDSVKRVSDIVAEIAAASREQSAGIGQVNEAVAQMDKVTQSNQAMTEEAAATAETLDGLSHSMEDLIRRFSLTESAKVTPSIRAPRPESAPGAESPTMDVAELAPTSTSDSFDDEDGWDDF